MTLFRNDSKFEGKIKNLKKNSLDDKVIKNACGSFILAYMSLCVGRLSKYYYLSPRSVISRITEIKKTRKSIKRCALSKWVEGEIHADS